MFDISTLSGEWEPVSIVSLSGAGIVSSVGVDVPELGAGVYLNKCEKIMNTITCGLWIKCVRGRNQRNNSSGHVKSE